MLAGGDEMGRTQGGNNNAYCQDNEISWVNWDLAEEERDLLEFCRFLIGLRKDHPVFRRRRFFQGRKIRGAEVKDLTWFEPSGQEMTDQAWEAHFARTLMVRLGGDSIDELDENGERIADDTFLLLLNSADQAMDFVLPAHRPGLMWERLFDTGEKPWGGEPARVHGRYRLRPRSIALLRTPGGGA